MSVLAMVAVFFRRLLRGKLALAAENLALRQQLAIQQRSAGRPKLRKADRVPWVWLQSLWINWRSALLIVKPETVVRWHRQGFRLYWTRKSKAGRRGGRPKVESEIRALIRRMSRENPTWGVPRVRAEMALSATTSHAQPSGSASTDRTPESHEHLLPA